MAGKLLPRPLGKTRWQRFWRCAAEHGSLLSLCTAVVLLGLVSYSRSELLATQQATLESQGATIATMQATQHEYQESCNSAHRAAAELSVGLALRTESTETNMGALAYQLRNAICALQWFRRVTGEVKRATWPSALPPLRPTWSACSEMMAGAE